MLEFGSVAVLVDNWRAIASNAPKRTYYYITGFKWRPCGTIDYIKHSATVYNASLLFSQNLNDSKASVIIGVHIRGERLLTQYKGNPMYCLEKLDSFSCPNSARPWKVWHRQLFHRSMLQEEGEFPF